MSEHLPPADPCFLCAPDPRLVFAESDHYIALLGIGPIVEGYSLLATKDHAASMFDVPENRLPELVSFTSDVKALLAQHWEAPTITEHGRVGLCQERRGSHDTHCFHAHQLLFPTALDFSSCLAASRFSPIEASSFLEARRQGSHLTEYLYYEAPDGRVLVGCAPENMRRQFFRRAVAEAVGHPEWQSWRTYPRMEVVSSALCRLRRAA